MGSQHYQGSPMTLRHLLIALCFALTTTTPAFAAPVMEPFPKLMKYRIAWNNIKIGRVIIEANQTPYSYRMSIDTKTTGMLKMFSPLKSVTWASGRLYEGQIIPQKYNSRSSSDEGNGRSSELLYDEEGTLAQRTTIPVDDPSWRPEVPMDEARKAFDPITAYFIVRAMLYNNVNRGIKDTYIKTYDGRRLAEFQFKAVNNGTRLRDDKVVPVINTVAFRKPINGYTPKELKRYEEGDPKVHIYFSADKRFLPIEFEIYHWSGKISASLEE